MIRKAKISDVKDIQKLLTNYASQGQMLSRSLSELYDSLRDFYIFEDEGRVVGTSALHIVWEDLAEVRSVAVASDAGRRGIGSQVVGACLDEARVLGLKRLFCLTYKPDFFAKFGFVVVDKSELPHKVWGDCIKCVKFPDCDEIAMILDLQAGSGQGVLVTELVGVPGANPISGDFSVGAAGFYLVGGEVAHPVKGIAIAGNLLDLFAGVAMVADDVRFFGSVGAPSLRIAELDVSGS